MKMLFCILAALSVLMVLLAGSGAYLISKTLITQSKVDAVSSSAKGIASSLSLQVNLYDRLLANIAQDPDIIAIVIQKKPELLTEIEKKLTYHFPDSNKIKIITTDQLEADLGATADLSFADQQMVKQTLVKNQPSAIQGDGTNRHLSITRKIISHDKTIAVILAEIKYDFIKTSVAQVSLAKGYLEVRQDKLVLALAGEKSDDNLPTDTPISVGNTDWKIYFDNSGMTTAIEFSLIFSVILILALLVILSFIIGYRKLTDILRIDLAWVIKAGKDLLTDKPLTNYPVETQEVKTVVTTLIQFKRVATDKTFDF